MKYKWLWVVAFAAILVDFGMTAVAIQHDQIEEANPTAVDLMDEYGVIGGMLITVGIRWSALFLGLAVQRISPRWSWVPIAFLLPVSVYPVVHNLWIIGTLIF